MADYTRGTGNGGIMLIRDHGYNVEFHIKAGYTTSFANQMPWNWIINGVGGSATARYSQGAPWLHLGTFAVGTTQDIKFGIGATGTSGLGGPTDFWLRINRSTVPGAPSQVYFSQVSGNAVHCTFEGYTDGGSPITMWEIGYGFDPNYPTWFVGSWGSTSVGGLQPGRGYYFWARGHNANGAGPWGPRSTVWTANVPAAPSAVWVTDLTQTTLTTRFAGQSDGGMPIIEWQLAYGTDPNAGQAHPLSSGTNYLTGLLPGTTYYFWARGRNGVGWGPWGPRSQVHTYAGAKVRINGLWREAVPYVKVAGVWKMARPWVNVAGNWRQTE